MHAVCFFGFVGAETYVCYLDEHQISQVKIPASTPNWHLAPGSINSNYTVVAVDDIAFQTHRQTLLPCPYSSEPCAWCHASGSSVQTRKPHLDRGHWWDRSNWNHRHRN